MKKMIEKIVFGYGTRTVDRRTQAMHPLSYEAVATRRFNY